MSRSVHASTWMYLLLFTIVVSPRVIAEEKIPALSVDDFVTIMDKDGDGEVDTDEAKEYLDELENRDSKADVSMSALMTTHRVDFSFSYGGNSISVAEMTDHLEHMLTGDRVAEWVKHGLRLPQYAEAFKQNSIDGLDFPKLVSNDGEALLVDLGISSSLHKSKIQAALLRQVFGIGQVPDPPQSLACRPMVNGITLHWKLPVKLGTPPLHKFLIRRRKVCPSGVKGSWKELGDTAEESWWDSDLLEDGVEYEYRVQSWCAHGPSTWANVTGCKVDVPPPTHKEIYLGKDPDVTASGLQKSIASVSQGLSQVSAAHNIAPTVSKSSNGHSPQETVVKSTSSPSTAAAAAAITASFKDIEQQSGDGTILGFMWSINGGILILGLLSRSSFLFRLASSTFARLQQVFFRFLPCLDSPSPAMRQVARALNRLMSAIQGLGLAVLGALGLIAHSEQLEQCSDPDHRTDGRISNLGSRKNSSTRSLDSRSSSEGLLPPPSPSGECSSSGVGPNSAALVVQRQGTTLLPGVNSGVFLPGATNGVLELSASDGDSLRDSEAGSKGSAEIPLEGAHMPKGKGIQPQRVNSLEKSNSSKNRCCAHECQVAFSGVSGVLENLRKHYCRDCQSWYCARHTRIASHSTSFCRFDSQCRCFSCFARLPASVQSYLETRNVLQSEKQRSEARSVLQPDKQKKGPRLPPGITSSSTELEKMTSRGGAIPPRKPAELEYLTATQGTLSRKPDTEQRGYPSLVLHVAENAGTPGNAGTPRKEAETKNLVHSPGTVRRSTSECLLRYNFRSEAETPKTPITSGNTPARVNAGKGRVMKKCVSSSSAEDSPLQLAARSEQDGQWFRGKLPTFSLGGGRHGEAPIEAGSLEPSSNAATLSSLKILGGNNLDVSQACTLEATVQGNSPGELAESNSLGDVPAPTTDRAETPLSVHSPGWMARENASCERIPESVTEEGGIVCTQVERTDGSERSAPSSGGSSCYIGSFLSSGTSNSCRQPSFGRSRSLRTESSSLSLKDRQGRLTPSPRDSSNVALLHHRCNSLENLCDLDELHVKKGDDPLLRPSNIPEQGRKQLNPFRGAFKKVTSLSTILPGSSLRFDESSRSRRRDLTPKTPIDAARAAISKLKLPAISASAGSD